MKRPSIGRWLHLRSRSEISLWTQLTGLFLVIVVVLPLTLILIIASLLIKFYFYIVGKIKEQV